jgi:hypothetical protein
MPRQPETAGERKLPDPVICRSGPVSGKAVRDACVSFKTCASGVRALEVFFLKGIERLALCAPLASNAYSRHLAVR